MAASTVYDPVNDLESKYGLVEGHAFAIISVFELGDGTRLLKIRNPWGSKEWNGAWSDTSPEWTPALKRDLGWTSADDGTFFSEW